MRLIVSAGGTGGHLYPALALVDYIKTQEPDSEFLFVGTTDRLESKVVPELGYTYEGLHVKGMVGNPLQKAKNALIFVKSLGTSKKILKRFKPDAVVGFGGYPSASVVMAASGQNIPTMIHEQNSVIGLTNKILVKRVDEIVCCYDKAYNEFPKEKTKLLGNPRASAVHGGDLKDVHDIYNIPKDRKIVLFVMGSLGSASVNKVLEGALHSLAGADFDVLYVTGKNNYDEMKADLQDLADNIHLLPYIDDMPSVLSSVDVAVSRAGATTLAEITSLGTPSIIIPSPYVTANHQEYNARELYDKGACDMILEKDLTSEGLLEHLHKMMSDDAMRESIGAKALELGKPNACEDMYRDLKALLEEK